MGKATIDPKIIQAEDEAVKTSTSRGEQLFDWLTYGGIAGVVTFILSLPLGYWVRYTKGGQAAVNWSAGNLKKLGLSQNTAEDAAMTTALMQGGNLTLLPVKMMEDHKPQLVEKFNQMLGDKSVDASVEDDAKQTWMSLIKSRIFLAWMPVFISLRAASTMFGKEHFDTFEKKFAEYIVCKPLGMATHTPGLAKIVENETKLFRVGRIAAVDFFATAAASILLYMGSRFFAQRNEHWHAQHTHPKPDEAIPTSPQVTPEIIPDAAFKPVAAKAEEKPGRFADAITSCAKPSCQKERAESFTELLAEQKLAAAAETPLGISA